MTRPSDHAKTRPGRSQGRWALALIACGLLVAMHWSWLRSQPLPFGSGTWGALPLSLGALIVVAETGALLGLVACGAWLGRRATTPYGESPALRSVQPLVQWYQYLNPAGLVFNLYRHRHLLRQLTRRDIESRYKGSALGLVWSLVTPLLMLAIYTFVFSVIFRVRWRPDAPVDRIDFAITLFAGLIAFNVFAECINRAPALIAGHAGYVKRVVFPLEILPVSVLGSALFHAMVSAGVLVAGLFAVRHAVPLTVVWLPLVALPLVALSLGTAWVLASLGVYLRDTANAVTIATQMLFFMTPLFYPIEAVPAGFRLVLWLNPLTVVVDGFRRVAVWGQPVAVLPWAAVTLVSLLVLMLGYTWFMKTKVGFANVI